MESDFFQLSQGINNIHLSRFNQQHTHWIKSFLQLLLLLKICELIRFKQIKKRKVHFGLYESSLHFYKS